MTRSELDAVLAAATPGQIIVYAIGDLSFERQSIRAHDLDKMASYLWDLSTAGRLHLTQRRLGPDQFEYRATVASPK